MGEGLFPVSALPEESIAVLGIESHQNIKAFALVLTPCLLRGINKKKYRKIIPFTSDDVIVPFVNRQGDE